MILPDEVTASRRPLPRSAMSRPLGKRPPGAATPEAATDSAGCGELPSAGLGEVAAAAPVRPVAPVAPAESGPVPSGTEDAPAGPLGAGDVEATGEMTIVAIAPKATAARIIDTSHALVARRRRRRMGWA